MSSRSGAKKVDKTESITSFAALKFISRTRSRKSDRSASGKVTRELTGSLSASFISDVVQLSGDFTVDFAILGNESGFYRTPPVLMMPKPPECQKLAPYVKNTSIDHSITSNLSKTTKKTSISQISLPTLLEEMDISFTKEVTDRLGFKPKTFTVKHFQDIRQPHIHVEQETAEKPETISEVHIRGWKIESQILRNLSLCFGYLSKLHTLKFWRVGLSSSLISQLSDVLVQCHQIKNVFIEANESLENENYWELLKDSTKLKKLSIRFCHLTSEGAERIAKQLGNLDYSNEELISLDLSNNNLGNHGAIHLSHGLKLNRTLLQLSLSSNKIADEGAFSLSQALSQYPLTNKEIIERRKLLSLSKRQEREKNEGVSSNMTRSKGVNNSPLQIAEKEKSKANLGKTTKNKKDDQKAVSKSAKRDEKSVRKDVSPTKDVITKAKYSKSSKSKLSAAISIDSMEEQQVVVAAPVDATNPPSHPLLEKVYRMEDGALKIRGNSILILLNLSRNDITENGLKRILDAVTYQRTEFDQEKWRGTGIMKIMLGDNSFPSDSEAYQRLEEILSSRDPLRKSSSTEVDSTTIIETHEEP